MADETRRPQRSPIVRWRDSVRDSPHRDIKAPEVAVTHALASRMNGSLSCYPSVGTIARDARLSDRTVQRAIATLERLGFLRVNHSAGRKSNVYEATTPSELRGSTPSESAPNGDTLTPEVGTTEEGKRRRSAPAACPYCHIGTGVGRHLEDCPTLAEPDDTEPETG